MKKYPPMKGFTVKELAEALNNPSHPRHKAARMAATHEKGYETPKVVEKKEKVAKKMLPKENVQEAVSYKKSRSHRLLKEQEKKIHSKYYN